MSFPNINKSRINLVRELHESPCQNNKITQTGDFLFVF